MKIVVRTSIVSKRNLAAPLAAATLLSALALPAARVDAEAAASQPPPLSAYGSLPNTEEIAISPDGEHLAIIVTDGERRTLVITTAADLKPIAAVNAGDAKVRQIQWAGPRHLLITTSKTADVMDVEASRHEWSMLVDYDITTQRQKPLLFNIPNAMNVLTGTPKVRMIEGKPVVLAPGEFFVGNTGRVALFRVELDGDIESVADQGFAGTRAWTVDRDGLPLAETEYDAAADRWTLRVKRGAWQKVKTGAGQPPALMGLGRDGQSILLHPDVHDQQPDQLVELARGADDWGAAVSTGESQRAIVDPADHRMIGVNALIGDDDTYTFFDAHDQAVWKSVTKAFKGDRVDLVSWTDDRRKLVLLVDDPQDGAAYYLLDVATMRATWLRAIHPGALVSPTTPFAFKAKDGTPLTGYLTTPKGVDPRNLPLVVLPHDGPESRDEPGFDWWAQAMASRGYAVLQVNFRGSGGFGWTFKSAGFGQWGRAMQTDLSDGVQALANEGKIDPKRVCIVGANYGGYAALAGATLQPDVYRCAVDVAGPSDLKRFVAWSRQVHGASAQRYWFRLMGADTQGDPHLDDISPADHADRARGPILLIHGKDDTVVPFSQSQIMADALKKAGKPYDLVVLKAEDHWLSRGATRLQMLQAVIDFLQKNNPPN